MPAVHPDPGPTCVMGSGRASTSGPASAPTRQLFQPLVWGGGWTWELLEETLVPSFQIHATPSSRGRVSWWEEVAGRKGLGCGEQQCSPLHLPLQFRAASSAKASVSPDGPAMPKPGFLVVGLPWALAGVDAVSLCPFRQAPGPPSHKGMKGRGTCGIHGNDSLTCVRTTFPCGCVPARGRPWEPVGFFHRDMPRWGLGGVPVGRRMQLACLHVCMSIGMLHSQGYACPVHVMCSLLACELCVQVLWYPCGLGDSPCV